MVRITGAKAHSARLKRLRGAAMTREVGKAIKVAADLIEGEAENSITAGSSSGQVRGSKHAHTPSRPGEAPNNEFGDLIKGIVTAKTGPLSAEVRSEAPHAVPLEFGTSKMAERPYMRPAAARTRPKAQALVAAAVTRVVRGGTL